MAYPELNSRSWHERIEALMSGIRSTVSGDTGVGSGTGTQPDPDTDDETPSPPGQSTVANWRSRVFEPVTTSSARQWFSPSPGRELQLLGVTFRFVTSATAGDRQLAAGVELNRSTGGLGGLLGISPYLQPASTTIDYQFAVGLPAVTEPQNGIVTAPLPPMVISSLTDGGLSSSPRFSILTLNAPVSGDAFSYCRFLVAERVVS